MFEPEYIVQYNVQYVYSLFFICIVCTLSLLLFVRAIWLVVTNPVPQLESCIFAQLLGILMRHNEIFFNNSFTIKDTYLFKFYTSGLLNFVAKQRIFRPRWHLSIGGYLIETDKSHQRTALRIEIFSVITHTKF